MGRLALSGPASGKATLTVPTAASKAGWNGTFFHTDVWLMNRSYCSSTPVTFVYDASPGWAAETERRFSALPRGRR